MKGGLFWSQIRYETEGRRIDNLKFTLKKVIFESNSELIISKSVGHELFPLLEKIIDEDATGEFAEDARKLIEAIKKHNRVNLNIRY